MNYSIEPISDDDDNNNNNQTVGIIFFLLFSSFLEYFYSGNEIFTCES